MRTFNTEINEPYFNLLWRALAAREQQFEDLLTQHDAEDAEFVQAHNDLSYLRLAKKQLKQQAEQARFSQGVFSISNELLDLSQLS